MNECDDFFSNLGIPFAEDAEDAAIAAVRQADFYDPNYKKWLIICWYDTTFGEWQGSRYVLLDSRVRMSSYLSKTPYRTFEDLLEKKYF
jgi:hypothetical protein